MHEMNKRLNNMFGVLGAITLYLLGGYATSNIFDDPVNATLAVNIMGIAVLWFFYFGNLIKADKEKFKIFFSNKRELFRGVGKLFGIWYILQVFSSKLYTDFSSLNFDMYNEASDKNFIGFCVLSLLVAPVFEELFFRGFIFGKLRENFGTIAGGILNTLLFVAIHGTIVHIPITFILGLVLTTLYYETDNIFVSIIVHMICNSLSFLLVGLPIIEIFNNYFVLVAISLWVFYRCMCRLRK